MRNPLRPPRKIPPATTQNSTAKDGCLPNRPPTNPNRMPNRTPPNLADKSLQKQFQAEASE